VFAFGPPPRLIRVAFFAACSLVLFLTHCSFMVGEAEFPHLSDLTNNLAAIESGHWLRRGPELWETSMRLGGPLYYWANLPALAMGEPVNAIHLWMALLELAGLFAWLWLGTRARLGHGFTWGGALLLAAYAGPKTVVCENMTLAVILAIPLFVSAAAALARSGWWRWLLPGFLFGFMVQVHNATLIVGPALALAMLAQPRRFPPRILGFAAGWLPLLIIALLKPGAGAAADLPGFAGNLLQSFDALATLKRAALALGDPLLLLGLLLLITRQLRHRMPASLVRLALLWLFITDLLLSGVLQIIGRDGGATLQYALLNPPRAALAGVALVWLFETIHKLLPLRITARRFRALSMLLVAFSLVAWRGWQGAQNRNAFNEEWDAAHKDPCACAVWNRRGFSRFASRYHAVLWNRGLPWTSTHRVELAGLDDSLGAAVYWLQRTQPGWLESHHRARPTTVLAAPQLPGLDLSRLPGVVDYGPFFMAPELLTEAVSSRKELMSHRVSLSEGNDRDRLLFLVVDGTRRHPGQTTYTLTRGGRPLTPTSTCACTDMSSKMAGWFAYDLDQGDGKGQELLFKADGPVVVHHVTAGTIKPLP
jgi:hypothetical protein